MLSYVLAIAVALTSLVLFSTAFLMSDIHRQDDFLWSGVGLFYALILWYSARNITGAVLLGQAAAATLVVSYSWQTLKLRKAVANPAKAEEINNFSILQAVNGLLKRNKPQSLDVATETTPSKVTESEIAIPDTTSTDTLPTEAEIDNAQSAKPEASDKSINNDKVVIINDRAKSTSNKQPKEIESDTQPATKETAANPIAIPDTTSTDTLPTDAEIDNARSVQPEASDKSVNNDQAVVIDDQAKSTSNKQPKEIESDTQPATKETAANTSETQPQIGIELGNEKTVSTQSSGFDNTKAAVEENQVIEKVENDSIEVKEIQNTPENQQPEIANSLEPEAIVKSDSPPVTTENSTPQITENTVDTKSEETEIIEPTPTPEPQKKPSKLDSLETVEVAEVLEAEPEMSDKGDRINIIEVTTEEVNIIVQDNSDSETNKPDAKE